MSDTDDDILVTVNIVILVCSSLLRRRRARKRQRRFWVRPIWRYWDTGGQANTLLPRLRTRDEMYFREFLRMPPSVFDTLLVFVRPLIERQVTTFRDPISVHDRLAMTLRGPMDMRYNLATYFMNEGSELWQEGIAQK
ncbi:hypothetical protein HPB50_008367 [Hyalomma asiaticum]|uniref:Uncharacterized protein n=1 Tax=Hyalomma asiaticum TaxID=266040 RepID=A0ACB7RSI4_HYAAI|nr:hypothetical protein HPB50_008367 [Hyalomma asiaticum]